MKARIPTKEEIQRAELKSYVDLIAPSILKFKGHSSYYIVGNTYRSVWAIRGYPLTVKKDSDNLAMLRELGESDGVTLHIYARDLREYEQNQIMESAQKRNRMKTGDFKVTTATKAEQNMQDIQNLITTSYRKKESFMYCAVFIEIIANSLEQLKSRQSEISSILNQHKILVDKLYSQQKKGFLCVMPNGRNLFASQFERVLPASSVANLFPLSYSGKTDPHGYFLGKDENGSNIIADFDYRTQDKTNGHILILGNSGEGKSYLMKLIIVNMLLAGKKIYILDPDDEYADLTKNLGGTYLNMMSGEYRINPLEPRLWAVNTDGEEALADEPIAFKKGTQLSQHIAFLRDFFMTYRNFTESELDVIEIMLEETYSQHHISDDIDLSNMKSNDYPILSDLYRVIENKLSTYEEDLEESMRMKHPIMYTRDQLQAVGLGLKTICIGAMSRYFNGVTNIPNANFIDFSVKEALSTNENLKNAMFFNIFSFMSHKFLTEGECALFVDELHEFVKNQTAISYITSFEKRGRKKESNVILASQNVEDLLRPDVIHYTKPLLLIPAHSFLFHPGGNCNPKEYQSNLNVKPYEYETISTPNQGHCLYKCGTERYALHVIAPEHKSQLFGTAGGRGAA